MKAKVYYVNPKALRQTPKRHHGLTLSSLPNLSYSEPLLILPASALDGVIESAAKAMYAEWRLATYPTWVKTTAKDRESWRTLARAAYSAGGFCQ